MTTLELILLVALFVLSVALERQRREIQRLRDEDEWHRKFMLMYARLYVLWERKYHSAVTGIPEEFYQAFEDAPQDEVNP